MAMYRIAVGTHDPVSLDAVDDDDAIRQGVTLVRERFGDDLSGFPQEVATLIGPAGLLTRPSERVDEFVTRVGPDLADGSPVVQPGDSNTPDCNGD